MPYKGVYYICEYEIVVTHVLQWFIIHIERNLSDDLLSISEGHNWMA